jgi:hypothetical protein
VLARVRSEFKDLMKKLKAKKDPDNNKGSSFLEKIYDNLTLRINKIDFRIDVVKSPGEKLSYPLKVLPNNGSKGKHSGNIILKNYSFGGFVYGLDLCTVDLSGQKIFFKREDKF